MRAKRRWAAFAATVGLLAGSLGGGVAIGADSMKQGDSMQQTTSSGDAMKGSSSGDAMQQQTPAASGAAMSAAQMTG